MLDRVTGMQVFVRVAALGSFSAAARALDLSQTMVTKHVAALEDRLGIKLLHRSTRKLVLTEGGRSYLAACERILAEIEEAEVSASLDRVEPRGTLRLNVPLTFGFRADRSGPRRVQPALPGRLVRSWPRRPLRRPDRGRLGPGDPDRAAEGFEPRRPAPCRLPDRRLRLPPPISKEHGTPRTLDDLARHNCLGYTLPSAISANRWAFGTGWRHRRAGPGQSARQ